VESLGDLSEVDAASVLAEHEIDRVIISAEGIEDERLLELVCLCRNLGVRISALPSLAAMMGPSATIDHLEGITLNRDESAIAGTLLTRVQACHGHSRGAVPVALGGADLDHCCDRDQARLSRPRVVSPGAGRRRGRPFRLVKFRSMVCDAEERREGLLKDSRQVNWLDLEHDPRITRVGRFSEADQP